MKRSTWTILLLLIAGTISAQNLEVILQEGHPQINDIALHPSGKYVVTAGNDTKIKVWDYESGYLLRTLTGHTAGNNAGVNGVQIDPSGKFIVSDGDDGTVRIWNIETGTLIRTLAAGSPKSSNSGGQYLRIDPAGKYIAYCGCLDTVKIWDLHTGKLLQQIDLNIYAIDIGRSGKLYASGYKKFNRSGSSGPQNIYEINMASGGILKTYHAVESTIRCLDASSDERYLATGHDDSLVRLWDTTSGNIIRGYRVYDYIVDLEFDEGGQRFVACDNDAKLFVFDVNSEKTIASYMSDFQCRVFELGKQNLIIASGYQGRILACDLMTGKVRKTISGYEGAVWDFGFNPQQASLLSSYRGFTGQWHWTSPKTFNTIQGDETRNWDNPYQSPSKQIWNIGPLSDGRLLVSYSSSIYNVEKFISLVRNNRSMEHIHTFRPAMEEPEITISSSGKYGLISVPDKSIGYIVSTDPPYTLKEIPTRWDVKEFDGTGKYRKLSNGKYMKRPDTETVTAAVFDIGEKNLIAGTSVGNIRIWDFPSLGNEIMIQEKELYRGVLSIAVDPSGKLAACGMSDGHISIVDLTTRQRVRELSMQSAVSHVLFTNDGRLISAGEDGRIMLWDIREGRKLRDWVVSSGSIRKIAPDPSGRLLFSSAMDNEISVWDLSSGKKIAGLFAWEDAAVVLTPDGYFDGSGEYQKYMRFVKGLEYFKLDQFFEDFYRPGLLADIMKAEEIEKPELTIQQRLTDALPPNVKIVSPGPGMTITQKDIEVTVKCTDQGGGIEDIRLYHNDKLISEDTRGIKIASQDFTKTFQVSLLEGENRLKATAFSPGRIEARPDEVIVNVKGVSAEVNSYIFAIVINHYKNGRYNLNYARGDAEAFRILIESRSGKLFRNVHVHELYDSTATASGIKSVIDKIVEQAQPQDVFTFYYAGHGVMVPDEKGKQQFYLVPHEMTLLYDEKQAHDLAVSGEDLVEFSRKIKARKQLFVIDACQSGGIQETFALRGAAEEKALAQLARSSGIHVFASTQSDQFAAEFQELGHGVFTYALIQGIEGSADGSPADGKVTIAELNAYLQSVLPELTEKHKGQAQYPVIYSRGQDFPVVVK